MIGKLTGTVDEKGLHHVLVDVGGVGYEVAVPESTSKKIPSQGQKVTLFIYTHVREDAIILYGFATKEEKELFQTVLGVSGVGPKLALSILSDLNPDSFKRAVVNQDIKQLSRVSGVGKRTAERLVLELKDKFQLPKTTEENDTTHPQEIPDDVYAEALAALQALGYTLVEAEGALAMASQRLAEQRGSSLSTQALVSQALKVMA